LRFVVGRSLEGHGHDLKERILGIEVFDRPPDYDTNIDPIVRGKNVVTLLNFALHLSNYRCENLAASLLLLG
jgi:hypothetical protein